MHRRAFLTLGALLPVALPSVAAADELTDLRKKGVLRVATSDDYAPFAWMADGRRSGLDIDMIALLSAELGVRAEFVPFKWPELSLRLDQGAFDVASSGITMRADRMLFGRFSRPYAITGAVACFRKEDAARFSRASDLDKPSVRIAVNRGGHLAQVARSTFPKASLELLDKNSALFNRVTSRAVDAAVSDSAEVFAASPGLSVLGPFTRDRKAFFVRREAPGLVRFIDQWLFRHENDGSLPKTRRRWLGSPEPTLHRPHLEAVLADVELRLELMPWVGAAKRALRMPIEDLAQEERVLARVRTLSKEAALDSKPIEDLYRVLIRAAKIIQMAPVLPGVPAATLDALREAIGATDEHLISNLRSAAPRVPPTEWQKAVPEGVRNELLPPQIFRELAAALSAVRRVQAGHG
jgi:cyclohexadienyl dehydratase